MTPRERRVLLAVGAVYAAVVIPVGIHKGGDFTHELEQSERLLHGLPLYEANPDKGIWWPPFTALDHGLAPLPRGLRVLLQVAVRLDRRDDRPVRGRGPARAAAAGARGRS